VAKERVLPTIRRPPSGPVVVPPLDAAARRFITGAETPAAPAAPSEVHGLLQTSAPPPAPANEPAPRREAAETAAMEPQTPRRTPQNSAKARKRRHQRRPQDQVGLVQREYGTRRQMTIYVRPETAARLKAWCRTHGRELSHTVDEALAQFLDRSR